MKTLLLIFFIISLNNAFSQNANTLRNGSWRPSKDLYKWKTNDSINMTRPYADSSGDLNFTIKGDLQQFHVGQRMETHGKKQVMKKTESWDYIAKYTFGKTLDINLDGKIITAEIASQSPTRLKLKIIGVVR